MSLALVGSGNFTTSRERLAMSEDEKVIESEILLGLTIRCPECGTIMKATGKMHYNKTFSQWFVDYWCPRDKETIPIYTPETDQLARDIAKDAI